MEVSEPHRNVPRALVGGVIFVGVAYLVANAAYFYALPLDAVARSAHVASDVVERFADTARRMGHVGDGRLGAGDVELLDPERSASAVCDGARPAFFSIRRLGHQRFRTPAAR